MVENTFSQKQIEAVKHIRNWLIHHGRTPSVRELMGALGYKSPKSAQDILKQLEERGVVKKLKSGDYRFVANPDLGPIHAQTIDVPLVGTVACGAPILAEENIVGSIPVSISLAKPGFGYYLLRVRGDSMDDVGINDGDLVLVRQQPTANEGEYVVALINEGATIKEYHRENDVVVLKPRSRNKDHRSIILSENFQIQGVVMSVIPNFE